MDTGKCKSSQKWSSLSLTWGGLNRGLLVGTQAPRLAPQCYVDIVDTPCGDHFKRPSVAFWPARPRCDPGCLGSGAKDVPRFVQGKCMDFGQGSVPFLQLQTDDM